MPLRHTRPLLAAATFAALFLLVCSHRIGILTPPVRPAPAPYAININKDNALTLSLLPGITQPLADRIVASRYQQGPFNSPQALLRVPGITPDTLQRIAPYITATRL